MNEREETVADIMAEMRDYSNTCNDGYHADYGVVCTDMRNYANRLEAAWKRERAEAEAKALAVGGMVEAARENRTTEKSSAVGDAAAMREALENSNGLLEELAVIGEWGESARGQIAENNAALAAPARNCDKYANHNDAMRAFDAFVREQGKLGFINPYTESFKWLFATATEKEGEADGRK